MASGWLPLESDYPEHLSAEACKTPICMSHGLADRRVPVIQLQCSLQFQGYWRKLSLVGWIRPPHTQYALSGAEIGCSVSYL